MDELAHAGELNFPLCWLCVTVLSEDNVLELGHTAGSSEVLKEQRMLFNICQEPAGLKHEEERPGWV